jgi:hypothetical protein
MGASILVHWPDATEEDEGDHPGFSNDDHAWASWLVAALQSASAMQLLQQLGVAALLSHTTEGADADEIEWTTPDELERAANALRERVERNDPEVQPLLELYEADAPGQEEPSAEFARDLGDVAQIAGYARGLGASKVTLGYYW